MPLGKDEMGTAASARQAPQISNSDTTSEGVGGARASGIPASAFARWRLRNPSLAFPQPHARLIAVRELDAGGFEGGADIRQNVMVRRSGLSLKISDSLCRNLARLGKLVLGPLEKRACSSTLGGGTRDFFQYRDLTADRQRSASNFWSASSAP